jgi:DNA modification methylase
MTLTTYERNSVHLWHGDCLQVLRSLPSASVSSVVTDPPYGLSELSQTQVVKALTA